jgi:hypothetical protein
MKDTRFIELVNLYIDRQISPEETAELEAEIRRNPLRRRTYQEYCRMHHATRLVHDSFRSGAEPAVAGRRYGVAQIAQRARQRRQRWTVLAGGLAAAACVAFVFVGTTGPTDPEAGPVAAPEARALASAPVPAAEMVEAPAPALLELERPVVVFASRSAAPVSDFVALAAALREEERTLAAPAAPGRLSLFEDGVFEPRADVFPVRNQPSAAPRRARHGAEFTAFQFQR